MLSWRVQPFQATTNCSTCITSPISTMPLLKPISSALRFKYMQWLVLFLACVLLWSIHACFCLHQILAGSYLSVAGALLGPLRAGKMSLFGTLITLWGLVKEVSSVQNPDGLSTRKVGYIYPTMLIAVLCAFLSIRRDLRKIIQCCRASRPIANSKHWGTTG